MNLTQVLPTFFKTIWIKLSIGVIIWQSSESILLYRSQCRKDAIFKLTDKNTKVVQNISRNFPAATLSHCARACLGDHTCKSINYSPSASFLTPENNCETLTTTKYESSQSMLSSQNGWNHYEPLNIEVRGNFIFCCKFIAQNRKFLINSRDHRKSVDYWFSLPTVTGKLPIKLRPTVHCPRASFVLLPDYEAASNSKVKMNEFELYLLIFEM